MSSLFSCSQKNIGRYPLDRSYSSGSDGMNSCEKSKDWDPFEGFNSRYPYHQPLKNSKGLPH
jgi:hypothetical protein